MVSLRAEHGNSTAAAADDNVPILRQRADGTGFNDVLGFWAGYISAPAASGIFFVQKTGASGQIFHRLDRLTIFQDIQNIPQGFEVPEGEYTAGKVEIDGKLITACGPAAAKNFALALVSAINGNLEGIEEFSE